MSDALPVAVGHSAGPLAGPGREGPNTLRRNSPALFNVAFRETLNWDGKASSLEEQALMPLLASDELATFRFSVEGHTDSVGSERFNEQLSRDRAAVVKAYLVARGVPEERLATRGHGETTPVATNETDSGRQRNRRVEVINLGTAE